MVDSKRNTKQNLIAIKTDIRKQERNKIHNLYYSCNNYKNKR